MTWTALASASRLADRVPRLSTLPRWILVLASIYTAMNCAKPIHIDDTAYYYYAANISRNPLDPYGFEVFWNDSPQVANQLLAPPALPYWWSIPIMLFGDRPVVWKIWLFPISALFVASLYRIFRRFSPGMEGPLVWLTVLSPTFLPALNLMLDVPSIALRFAGVALFLRSCDRDSLGRAMAAGALCGLAVETKYTGVLGPAAILVYSILARKRRLGLIAASTAGFLFVAWESWIALRYGQSHFVLHLTRRSESLSLGVMLEALLSMTASLAPYVTLLGLVALGLRGVALVGVATVLATPYILLVASPFGPSAPETIFISLGFTQWTILAAALVGRLLFPPPRDRLLDPSRRDWSFLLLWATLEVGGYLVLTPFLATRRVMGVVVLATLIAGRLVAESLGPRVRVAEVHGAVVAGVVLGFVFYGVDLREAFAQKGAAEQAARLARGGGGTAWFVGHWGFQFYCERAGMVPVIPGVSVVREGDRLVVPAPPVNQQSIKIDPGKVRLVHELHVHDRIPLRTVPGYYGDRSSVVLEDRPGPRVSVRIYKVEAEFTP